MFCFCKLLIYNLNLVGHTSCEIYTEAAVLTPAAHCDFGLQQKPSFTLLSSVIDGREPECHVGAGTCKRHELGVELQAGYWSCVLPV